MDNIKIQHLFTQFHEKIISHGGKSEYGYATPDLPSHPVLSKYNNQYIFPDFINWFSRIESADGSAWFLCMPDYESTGNTDSFSWNEFEKISLENAETSDEKEKIKKWWESHLPVAMSVKGDYTFLAIDLDNGNIVQGYAPEFEDTQVVAENNAFCPHNTACFLHKALLFS